MISAEILNMVVCVPKNLRDHYLPLPVAQLEWQRREQSSKRVISVSSFLLSSCTNIYRCTIVVVYPVYI